MLLTGVEESHTNSLPDSARAQVPEPNYSVKVKTIGQKGQRYTKRLPTQMIKMPFDSQKSSKAAQYAGAISSPHIKPEYINERMNSPSNMMRAKSIGPDPNQIPIILGQGIVQPGNVPDKPGTTENGRITVPFKKDT